MYENVVAMPATGAFAPVVTAKNEHTIDLILPCYNPPADWVHKLRQQYHALAMELHPVQVQVIVVNDGASQNTDAAQLRSLKTAIPGIILVNNPHNQGKGVAVRAGLAHARHRFQICTDLDIPFGIKSIKAVYEALLRGADVVAGQRGNAYVNLLPPQRRIVTRVGRFVNRHALGLKIDDAQAGLKGCNSQGKALLEATTIKGFLYDSEFIYHASGLPHITTVAVPVTCRPEIVFSSFGVKVLCREFFNYLKLVLSSQRTMQRMRAIPVTPKIPEHVGE